MGIIAIAIDGWIEWQQFINGNWIAFGAPKKITNFAKHPIWEIKYFCIKYKIGWAIFYTNIRICRVCNRCHLFVLLKMEIWHGYENRVCFSSRNL